MNELIAKLDSLRLDYEEESEEEIILYRFIEALENDKKKLSLALLEIL